MLLEGDTVRLIWAFHDEKPSGIDNVKYHGINRGVKSIYLKGDTHFKGASLNDADAISWKPRVQNVIVPPVDTYYHCEMFKAPDTKGRKMHMTGVRFPVKIRKLLIRVFKTLNC